MTAALSEELLGQVSEYIGERMGLHFPKERWKDLERGLRRAAPELGQGDAESCARRLLLSPLTKPQVEILASHLTIGETYFFRDGKMFELLEQVIFPELIQKRRDAGNYLRIWSAGCSTGEEPYSIAILLRRLLHDFKDWHLTVLATDINPAVLRRASQGVYGEWSFRDTPPWLKARYFHKTGDGRFEVHPEIRKHVTFSYHNLAEDHYPSLLNNTNAMDLILCRNVLMYFSRDRQRSVVEKLYHCLVNGGRLIVSPIEISAAHFSPFVPVRFPSATLYQKDINSRDPTACPISGQPFHDIPSPGEPAPSFETVMAPPPAQAGASPGMPEETEKAAAQADLFQEALTSYRRGCYPDAEKTIAALLDGRGNHAPALALLARIRANAGALPEARDLCEKAVTADKLNPGYHYLLATILQEMGLPDPSAEALRRALYLDQGFVLAHFSLGNTALRQGKGREAARHFKNALAVVRTFGRDDILPESEGVTAGRMEEIIRTTMSEGALA